MGIEDATRVMLHVHQRGVGVCGVFSYEVAETKVTQVMELPGRTSTRCNARWKRRRPLVPPHRRWGVGTAGTAVEGRDAGVTSLGFPLAPPLRTSGGPRSPRFA